CQGSHNRRRVGSGGRYRFRACTVCPNLIFLCECDLEKVTLLGSVRCHQTVHRCMLFPLHRTAPTNADGRKFAASWQIFFHRWSNRPVGVKVGTFCKVTFGLPSEERTKEGRFSFLNKIMASTGKTI